MGNASNAPSRSRLRLGLPSRPLLCRAPGELGRRKAVLPRADPAEEGKEMTMPTNVDDIIRKLSPAQRKKVEARAAQLIAEEMTLRELRHARKLTQVRMAEALGITQDSVSRLEKRSDLRSEEHTSELQSLRHL